MSCNTPVKLDAIICARHAFVKNAHVLCSICLTAYAQQSCLMNNFADFPDVHVKQNPRFCSVVGGVFILQHLLFTMIKRQHQNQFQLETIQLLASHGNIPITMCKIGISFNQIIFLLSKLPAATTPMSLRMYCTSYPKLACFVLYFKIINTLKNNIDILQQFVQGTHK